MAINEANMNTRVLEINLISAQGLKEPTANLRRMQTYALTWVDPSTKLRTQVDRVGCDNPTWNDKFIFRVSPDFLSRETSGVSIEIYAVGCLSDYLIGTVRFLVSNLFPLSTTFEKTPSFAALQIRRPSGSFHGLLNIGARVIDGSYFATTRSELAAIGYRDLMKDSLIRRHRSKSMAAIYAGGEQSLENSFAESKSVDDSDGPDSTTSSPLRTSEPSKDRKGSRDLSRKNHVRTASDGGGMLSCFLMQRTMHVKAP